MGETFLGTSAFFAWDGCPMPETVRYLLLFEPPQPIDAALVLKFGHKVKQKLTPAGALPWRNRISIGALTLAEWNLRFPDYPAKKM